MVTSIMLAKIIGLYLTILGACMIFDCKQFKQRLSSMKANSDALFVAGFLELLVGLLIVLNHNVWVQAWPVIITIIGWLLIIEAVLALGNPKVLVDYYKCMCEGNRFCYMKVVVLVVGVLLIMAGFYDFKFCIG